MENERVKAFVPLTDELLYGRPDLIDGPLAPFCLDYPCYRWLVEPEERDVEGLRDVG